MRSALSSTYLWYLRDSVFSQSLGKIARDKSLTTTKAQFVLRKPALYKRLVFVRELSRSTELALFLLSRNV